GARIVEHAFLREDTDFEIDRPGIFLHERQHAFQTFEPDTGIHLELRTDVSRAVEDAALERALGALIDVFGGECLLCFRDFADRFVEIALHRVTAVEDAGLVEMKMRLDKARADEAAAKVDLLGVGGKRAFDRGDLALRNADIDGPVRLAGEPCVAKNDVHALMRSKLRRDKPFAATDPARSRGQGRSARRRPTAGYRRGRRP